MSNSNIKVYVAEASSAGRQISDMFKKKDGYEVTLSLSEEINLVVFPGGPDVDPKLYGEEPCKGTFVAPYRDKREVQLWEKLKDPKFKNVLKVGICRGAQFLNVMNGGALWQDVQNHAIRGCHGVLDMLLTKNLVSCTSTHHQMMIPNEKNSPILMGASWETNYQATEEWVSSIERDIPTHDTEILYYWDTHTYCFQPHPEMVGPDHECQIMFFDHLNYVMEIFEKNKTTEDKKVS